MIVQAVKWVGSADGFLELIDQRELPGKLVKLQCREVEHLCEAIKTLAVRGAPAIGVAAAYGQVLALRNLDAAADLQRGLAAGLSGCDAADRSQLVLGTDQSRKKRG
jgi:methylthioribose-1-phosphate isomerase